MLTCIPRSVFWWNFDVEGGAAGTSALTFDFFTERGTINHAGTEYSVCKYGWLSGQWGLESGGQTHMRAQKLSPLLRKFEIQEGNHIFILRAMPFTRCYDILQNDSIIGTISPAHFLTRRATIDCRGDLSELGQLFCFWIAVITWRRAAHK